MKATYKKPDTFRIQQPHSNGCYSIKNVHEKKWDTPWAGECIDGVEYGSIRSPDQKGMTAWLILRCNCTECPARLAVKAGHLIKGAPAE